jgi:hypothetical protein
MNPITPELAAEIEQFFSVTFLEESEEKAKNGKMIKMWIFTRATSQFEIRTIGFCTPVKATDHEVGIALTSALTCAGWHNAWFKHRLSLN